MTVVDPEEEIATPDGRPATEQPRWRRDFPIDWPRDEYIARRDLVKFMALTSLAFVSGQAWLVGRGWRSSRRDPPAREVAAVDEIPVGGARTFIYPEEPHACLLVRTGESSFVAYDQQCTHLLCPVVPRVEEGILLCPCHHGVFDLESGRALAGPPRRRLARVTLDVRDGRVWATGLEGPEG